jgi:hypothetical protein
MTEKSCFYEENLKDFDEELGELREENSMNENTLLKLLSGKLLKKLVSGSIHQK